MFLYQPGFGALFGVLDSLSVGSLVAVSGSTPRRVSALLHGRFVNSLSLSVVNMVLTRILRLVTLAGGFKEVQVYWRYLLNVPI